jgi:polyhydroxybutyrate depolymerase
MPLVIVLHGGGQEVADLEEMSEMSYKADEAGFLVVYPQASLLRWDLRPREEDGVDVVFIEILLVYLQRHLSIDPARIYVAGFSNGASLAHRLGCDLADRIAAIAPVSGAYPSGDVCEPSRPVPVVAFHGTGDTYVAYQDGEHDVPGWAAGWAVRNGCDPRPVPGPHQGDVRSESWENCRAGAAVMLYTIEGGRHIWPGSARAHEFFPEVEDLSANDFIWAFFQAHPKE